MLDDIRFLISVALVSAHLTFLALELTVSPDAMGWTTVSIRSAAR